MNEAKILYGISGIGNGHTNRQLPIIEHYSQSAKMMIFAYDESLRILGRKYEGHPNVRVQEVAVPFYAGNSEGLDFAATLHHPNNQGVDFFSINMRAFIEAEKFLGTPDVVISDYEQNSAQYSYAKSSPLVTYDQQSKYLRGDFPRELGGTAYADEVERLLMFFPKAAKRIACSFFKVPDSQKPKADVELIAPILKDSIVKLRRSPRMDRNSMLVYLSSQRDIDQPIEEVLETFAGFSNIDFHVFMKQGIPTLKDSARNIYGYSHGDKRFSEVLSTCNGIISTAGHSLLSEAMFLDIPVYAIPLKVYEQQMNAYVIGQNRFGVSVSSIERGLLNEFLDNIPKYERNIKNDRDVLLRDSSLNQLTDQIDSLLS